MTPTHHLTDALLMAYAAGQLPEAFNLVVATHVSMCDTCRATAEGFDAVGGGLIGCAAPEPMAEDALDRVLGRVLNGSAVPVCQAPERREGLFPRPLQDYVGGDLASVKWRPIGMGVRQAILPTARKATARLLFIPSGAAMPDHGHRGLEVTLVLSGAFIDGEDCFGPGDVEIADEALRHTPTVVAGADCICLAATDAPLRFNGLVARMAQPFFRI